MEGVSEGVREGGRKEGRKEGRKGLMRKGGEKKLGGSVQSGYLCRE